MKASPAFAGDEPLGFFGPMELIPIAYRIAMKNGETKTVTGYAFDSGTDARLCVRYANVGGGTGWSVYEYNSGNLIADAGLNYDSRIKAAIAGIVIAAFHMGAGDWDKRIELACARFGDRTILAGQGKSLETP